VGASLLGRLLAVGVSLIATPVSMGLLYSHATSVTTLDIGSLAVRASIGLVAGAAAAAPLAVVLGRRLRGVEIPWLVASSLAGLIAAFTISVGLLANSAARAPFHPGDLPAQPSLVYPLVVGVVGGLVLGAAQAIVLGRYVSGVVWWIAASTVSFVLADIVIFSVNWQIAGAGTRPTTPTDFYLESIAGAVIGALIVGLVTGSTLVYLLGESKIDLTEATE
jgi:hypothetical protein